MKKKKTKKTFSVHYSFVQPIRYLHVHVLYTCQDFLTTKWSRRFVTDKKFFVACRDEISSRGVAKYRHGKRLSSLAVTMLSAVLANGCRHGTRKLVQLRDADCMMHFQNFKDMNSVKNSGCHGNRKKKL